jgi:hypothetical protein
VSIENNVAVVSAWPNNLVNVVDFVSGSYILGGYEYESASPQDPLGVLGRVVMYGYDNIDSSWKMTGELQRNKISGTPSSIFGYSVSVCSDFVSVGAPVVNLAHSNGDPCYTYTLESESTLTYVHMDVSWTDCSGISQSYSYLLNFNDGGAPFLHTFSAREGTVNVTTGANLRKWGRSDEPYASIVDPTNQISSSFPTTYSGSVFVYDLSKYTENPHIGNVFYKNGNLILTSTASNYSGIFTGTGSRGFELKYKGTHTIYEHEHLISIRPGEFNYSTNPSSLVESNLKFDVNRDGVFDFLDVDLIMRYLHKKKFFEEFEFDDNGIVLEQDRFSNHSWWSNDVLLTESEDVLLQEGIEAAYLASSSFNRFTKDAYDYIETELVSTGILDIDGNGKINLNDGTIISLYYFNTLTPSKLAELIDASSTRVYMKDVVLYLNTYCRNDNFAVSPKFLEYQYSSSYDPTGSYLAPFITTVGLYDNNQLVAVGKLGRPLKNMVDWPVNIVVRFDT